MNQPTTAAAAADAIANSSGEPGPLVVHELMTSAEVGELLRVSQATLCRWREQGAGPRVLWLSQRVPRYSWPDVRDWMQRSRS